MCHSPHSIATIFDIDSHRSISGKKQHSKTFGMTDAYPIMGKIGTTAFIVRDSKICIMCHFIKEGINREYFRPSLFTSHAQDLIKKRLKPGVRPKEISFFLFYFPQSKLHFIG